MSKWLVGLLIIGTFITLVPERAQAQRWLMILRAGGDVSSLSGDRLGGETITGFTAGIGAEIQANRSWGAEFNLAYVPKGGKGTITNEVASSPSNPPPPDPTIVIDGTAKLEYLEASISAVAHLSTGHTSEIRFYLGWSLGVLLNAEADGTATSDGEPIELDLEGGVKSVDSSFLVGAGWFFEIKGHTFLVDYRSYIGATDINDSNLEGDLRTMTHIIQVGFQIPLAQ